ncbi:MAG: VOC family protein [Candidatus Bathyarchaeia archaeon]
MIMAVDHVAIMCKDLERSVEYYTQTLGFSIMYRTETPSLNIAFLEKGEAKLELMGVKEGVATVPSPLKETDIGVKHIAFLVDDVDEAYEELKKRGVDFTSEPIATRGTHKIVFFNDPDGNVLQLTQW